MFLILDFSEEECEVAPFVFKDLKKKEKLGVVVGPRDPADAGLFQGSLQGPVRPRHKSQPHQREDRVMQRGSRRDMKTTEKPPGWCLQKETKEEKKEKKVSEIKRN